MASKTLASLVVRIGADVTGVTAGLNTLDKRARSLKKQFGSVRDSTLTWQASLAALAGATGAALAATKVFQLGAAVEETASKFRTVFGPATSEAQRFLDGFATSAGLTITQGRELSASVGAITQGMGFAQQASASLSAQILTMAGDIASFNNTQGGAERVTQAIISALNGETEALKESAKVVVLQADVMERAAQMTGKATGEITRQDKALATLSLIAERAGVAMGDLARTIDSPANRARKLVAEVLTLRDTFAHALLPAFSRVLDDLSRIAGAEGFEGLNRTVQENSSRIAAWAVFAIQAGKFAAQAFVAPIRLAFNLGQMIGELVNAYIALRRFSAAGAGAAMGRLQEHWNDIQRVIAGLGESFENMRIAAGDAFAAVPQIAADVVSAIGGASGGIGRQIKTWGEIGKDVADSFASSFGGALASVVTGAEAVGAAFKKMALSVIRDAIAMIAKLAIVRGLLSLFPGLGTGPGAFIPIPGLAHGGPAQAGRPYVVGEKGPELFVPKTSGTVVPNNKMQMGGGSVADFGAALAQAVASIPLPQPMTPGEAARDRYWIQFISEAVQVAKHNGVRFA